MKRVIVKKCARFSAMQPWKNLKIYFVRRQTKRERGRNHDCRINSQGNEAFGSLNNTEKRDLHLFAPEISKDISVERKCRVVYNVGNGYNGSHFVQENKKTQQNNKDKDCCLLLRCNGFVEKCDSCYTAQISNPDARNKVVPHAKFNFDFDTALPLKKETTIVNLF